MATLVGFALTYDDDEGRATGHGQGGAAEAPHNKLPTASLFVSALPLQSRHFANTALYFKKGCHWVPCFGALSSVTGTAFLSSTVTKG